MHVSQTQGNHQPLLATSAAGTQLDSAVKPMMPPASGAEAAQALAQNERTSSSGSDELTPLRGKHFKPDPHAIVNSRTRGVRPHTAPNQPAANKSTRTKHIVSTAPHLTIHPKRGAGRALKHIDIANADAAVKSPQIAPSALDPPAVSNNGLLVLAGAAHTAQSSLATTGSSVSSPRTRGQRAVTPIRQIEQRSAAVPRASQHGVPSHGPPSATQSAGTVAKKHQVAAKRQTASVSPANRMSPQPLDLNDDPNLSSLNLLAGLAVQLPVTPSAAARTGAQPIAAPSAAVSGGLALAHMTIPEDGELIAVSGLQSTNIPSPNENRQPSPTAAAAAASQPKRVGSSKRNARGTLASSSNR